MADLMAGYWGEFMRSGAPGGTWKPYDRRRDAHIQGIVEKRQVHGLHGMKAGECDFFMAATTKRISADFD